MSRGQVVDRDVPTSWSRFFTIVHIEHIEELLAVIERAPLIGGACVSRAYARAQAEQRDSIGLRPLE